MNKKLRENKLLLYCDRLHIVGRQHSRLAGPVDGAGHPALVDEDGVDDNVAVLEADLIRVLGLVVVHCLHKTQSKFT